MTYFHLVEYRPIPDSKLFRLKCIHCGTWVGDGINQYPLAEMRIWESNDGCCQLRDKIDTENTITDDYQVWSKTCPMCGQDTMQVVRPGKVQCSNCG